MQKLSTQEKDVLDKMGEKIKSEDDINYTPKSSSKISRKKLDLKKLQSMSNNPNTILGQFKAFVVGICGGDCAGKKEMIQYLFHKKDQSWYIADSTEQVCILHQDYFLDNITQKYTSKGTNWQNFYKAAWNLIIGNPISVQIKQTAKILNFKPAKLLIIQGSHIFMESPQIKPLFDLINTKVFIDSDSDIRLSRRIYKDTQDDGIDLQQSIQNYLEFIKPSYEKQIEPSKVNSDIILPHFGGGYNDHKKQNKVSYDSNIKNACALIISHVREQMKQYQQQALQLQNQNVFI